VASDYLAFTSTIPSAKIQFTKRLLYFIPEQRITLLCGKSRCELKV
jgi:hypothetical protein